MASVFPPDKVQLRDNEGNFPCYRKRLSITRPSNTTAYDAGDVIGIADAGTPANAGSAIHTFDNIGPIGGHVYVTDCNLEVDVASLPSGMTSFRLHLYSASPTAILDNAAFDLPSADRASYLGYVDMPTIPVDFGATLYAQNGQVNKKVKLADGSSTLYGILQTVGGFTPSSGAVKVIDLHTVAI